MPKIIFWWDLRRYTHVVYIGGLAYRAWAKYASDAFAKFGDSYQWRLRKKDFPPHKYKH